MYSVLQKIIRAILIFIPLVVLGWLVIKEVVPSGKVEAVYDMRRETPFISKLYPKDRVSEVQRDASGDFYRTFLFEPVYFDLKSSDKFEKVTLTVRYKNKGLVPLKMGPLVNKSDWLFDWRDFSDGAVGWQTKKEVFEFSKLAPEGQKFRFGFSVPGLPAGTVEISEIKTLFERKPLAEKEIVNKILDAVAWRLNRLFN